MMLLEEYATNKRAQQFLDYLCSHYSKTIPVDADEIKSLAHEYISVQISKGKELADEKHLFNTIRLITLNSAKDLKLKNYNVYEAPEDPLKMPEPGEADQSSYDMKDLFRKVDAAIRKNFINKENLLIAYEQCLLGGHTMDEVSRKFGISLGTIKTNMRMVRSFANQLKVNLN